MISVTTGSSALRIAVALAAGILMGAGRAVSGAEGAGSVDALGEKLARSESRATRLKLVTALGETGDAAALSHLLPALGDENFAVRKRVATAVASILGATGGRNPAALLVDEALSADLSPAGQNEVTGILDKLSPPGEAAAAILRYLKRGDLPEHVARQCVNALAKPRYADVDAVRDGLLEQVETADVAVAAAAASALGRMPMSEDEREEVVPVLLGQLALGDEDAPVREAARKALAGVTGEGEDRSAYDWRMWGQEQGYGDPGAPVAGEEVPAIDPATVVFTTDEPGSEVGRYTWVYAAVAVGAIVLISLLLLLRSDLARRSLRHIEATRRKARRSGL